jgi:hypothetical protein
MEKNSYPAIRNTNPRSATLHIQAWNGEKRVQYCPKIFLPVFLKGNRQNVLVRYGYYGICLAKKCIETGTAGERQEGEGEKDESERNRINDYVNRL